MPAPETPAGADPEHELSQLLRGQHEDQRLIAQTRTLMKARARRISEISDLLEELADQDS